MIKGKITTSDLKEELVNAITHGIGALLAVAALVLLIVSSDAQTIVSHIIFGVSLVILYLASTLYHSFRNEKVKRFFRKLDHIAIYLLIAGTYTPFCLHAVKGWLGTLILILIWTFAAAGIILKCFYIGKKEWLSLACYIVMGWIGILAIKPIYNELSFRSFLFLSIGGAAYTLGTIFYANERIKFNHSIWHLWVLAGSIFHFFSVLMI